MTLLGSPAPLCPSPHRMQKWLWSRVMNYAAKPPRFRFASKVPILQWWTTNVGTVAPAKVSTLAQIFQNFVFLTNNRNYLTLKERFFILTKVAIVTWFIWPNSFSTWVNIELLKPTGQNLFYSWEIDNYREAEPGGIIEKSIHLYPTSLWNALLVWHFHSIVFLIFNFFFFSLKNWINKFHTMLLFIIGFRVQKWKLKRLHTFKRFDFYLKTDIKTINKILHIWVLFWSKLW